MSNSIRKDMRYIRTRTYFHFTGELGGTLGLLQQWTWKYYTCSVIFSVEKLWRLPIAGHILTWDFAVVGWPTVGTARLVWVLLTENEGVPLRWDSQQVSTSYAWSVRPTETFIQMPCSFTPAHYLQLCLPSQNLAKSILRRFFSYISVLFICQSSSRDSPS